MPSPAPPSIFSGSRRTSSPPSTATGSCSPWPTTAGTTCPSDHTPRLARCRASQGTSHQPPGSIDHQTTGVATLAKSAVAQARARLGDEPMKWLFERCSSRWGHESARRHAWRGLAMYGVDGTTIRLPDSKENREHFGSQRGREETLSGYPLARLVTLMAL